MICSKQDLKQRIATLDATRDCARIKKFRDENVYYVGKSTEVILEQIAQILRGAL